jgi:hypothetical protein
MYSLRFTRRTVLGFDILICVKNRALPPLIIICGRLQRPVSDIFFSYRTCFSRVNKTAFQGGFFVGEKYIILGVYAPTHSI